MPDFPCLQRVHYKFRMPRILVGTRGTALFLLSSFRGIYFFYCPFYRVYFIGWVHHYTITREPLDMRVFLSSLWRLFLPHAHAKIPPVSPPVYSCKKSVERPVFKGNLQAYKKARRIRQAYLHQLMSVLMSKGTLVDINTRKPGIRVILSISLYVART